MIRQIRRTAITAILTLAAAGVFVFVAGEFFRLSAIRQHPWWIYKGLGVVRETVIAFDARGITPPEGFEAAATPEGAALFQSHCAQCHGAPGIAPDDFATAMLPTPPPLVGVARERPPREVFWFIRNGLKMSGMPSWEYRLADTEMWRITAMVGALPNLTPAQYASLLSDASAGPYGARDDRPAPGMHIPVPERGRLAMQVYGCRSCHEIPGIVGPRPVHVGPPLDDAGDRRYIAGVLPNDADNMVRWIMDPQEVDPLSLMPDLGVPQDVAQDMAAYLYQIAQFELPSDPPQPQADPDGRAP